MRNFKKRTIALVLASVVTVAGSFAADKYKNSLMGLTFEASNNGAMSMIVQTKSGYSGILNPIKRDANTYILTLPEMNSQAPTPDLTNNPYIQSVNIRTMPYTNNGSGYTRITIKTNNLQTLPVQHRIFLADSQYGREILRLKEIELEKKREEEEAKREREELQQRQQIELMKERMAREEAMQRQEALEAESAQEETEQEKVETTYSEPIDLNTSNATPQENNEAFFLVLGVFLIILFSAFLFVKAKDRMTELSGESLDLDVSADKKKKIPNNKKSSKKINKIKNTIKTLDSTYTKSASMQNRNEYTPSVSNNEPIVVEEENVVDLDKLFQEQVEAQKSEQVANDDENAALEDFLSGFSFDEEYGQDEIIEEPEEPEELYNEELFEQIINGNFKFNSDDFECINQLMRMEIADEAIRNAKDYLISNPIKPKSKDKILEDLITTYAIKQNINFTKKDVDALYKLINVEIDSDFITDLRTNPQRTKEIYEEMAKAKGKVARPSDIVTLKVSESLPNLAQALEKQGNKEIKSNYKPDTVYHSKGYDVSTLSVTKDLPDLSKEIDKKEAYISKPSAKIELVDNSYKIETLSISPDLQNISEALKNPKSFEKEEAELVVVDEKKLLENISQVQFKPFDDNTQDFEVLNDFDDFYAIDETDPNDVLTFEEIAAEFEELYSIKITNEGEEEQKEILKQEEEQNETNVDLIQQELAKFFGAEQTTLDDSEDVIYNLNKEIIEEKSIEKPVIDVKEETIKPINKIEEPVKQVESVELVNLEQKERKKIERERSKLSQDVLNKIQEKRAERQATIETKKEITNTKLQKAPDTAENQTKICVIENESYDVLSTVVFTDNIGCYLTKNSKGYFVVGYIGDKLIQIKSYESLKSEKIQARMSEKLENGTMRYLVRIGIHKFILDVDNENIKFIMDLC